MNSRASCSRLERARKEEIHVWFLHEMCKCWIFLDSSILCLVSLFINTMSCHNTPVDPGKTETRPAQKNQHQPPCLHASSRFCSSPFPVHISCLVQIFCIRRRPPAHSAYTIKISRWLFALRSLQLRHRTPFSWPASCCIPSSPPLTTFLIL
jgi:hypothetical protein